MDQFSTVHTSFIVDFRFTNNISILMGDSGTGKTAVFSFIRECMAINPNILCINYLDYQSDIQDMIRRSDGKLIVIDNADILLNDDTRKLASEYGMQTKSATLIDLGITDYIETSIDEAQVQESFWDKIVNWFKEIF